MEKSRRYFLWELCIFVIGIIIILLYCSFSQNCSDNSNLNKEQNKVEVSFISTENIDNKEFHTYMISGYYSSIGLIDIYRHQYNDLELLAYGLTPKKRKFFRVKSGQPANIIKYTC